MFSLLALRCSIAPSVSLTNLWRVACSVGQQPEVEVAAASAPPTTSTASHLAQLHYISVSEEEGFEEDGSEEEEPEEEESDEDDLDQDRSND